MKPLKRTGVAVGMTVPLLLAIGIVPAFADEMPPPPGCPPCDGAPRDVIPQLGPLAPLPADDPWLDPLIPENAVDDFTVEFAPPSVVIGDLSGIIPLRIPDGAWPVPEP